jgi:hypothetical protein
MSKTLAVFFLILLAITLSCSGVTSADEIRVTGAITSFTGNILGQNQTFFEMCPANTCGGPPTPPVATCPDTGCGAIQGIATVPFGTSPTQDTINQLQFEVDPLSPNDLIFKSAPLADLNPGSEFKLGTLTFTNGLWTGNADFGFSIVAKDQATGQTGTFNGIIRMILTPNTGPTPEANADFVYLLDANGTPVANLLTNVTLPSIRALENGTVSADIFGRFGSLDLTRIDDVTGDGFLDASLTNDLSGPPSTPTPEPTTLALLVAGTFILAAFKGCRL